MMGVRKAKWLFCNLVNKYYQKLNNQKEMCHLVRGLQKDIKQKQGERNQYNLQLEKKMRKRNKAQVHSNLNRLKI
jgi:hypothetical protein